MKNGYVIPVREKIAYGVGDLAINIAFGGISFYMLWFIVNVGGISPASAGIIFMVARIWDAITDYLMGRISDNTHCSMGRRKPYILFGALPMGLCFMAIWYVPQLGDVGRFIYYMVIYLLFNTAFTVVAVPYGSLMAQMTQNYDERNELSSYRVGLSFVGTLLAAAGISFITDILFQGYSKTASFLYMGIIFGALMVFILIITGLVSKERVIGDRSNYEGFFKTIVSFLKMEEFRNAYGLFLFNSVGVDIIITLSLFFIGDVLKVSGDATLFMAVPLVTAIVVAPLWTYVSNKLGKRKAYAIGAIYLIIVLALALIVPEKNTLLITVFFILAGVGISACQIIPMSILPDVIDIDEYQNGIRREGAFNGIVSLFTKTASGIAIAGVSILLEIFGYIKSNPDESVVMKIVQPESALVAIRVIMAAAPALCLILSCILSNRLKISKERFNSIIEELHKRNMGSSAL